MVFDLGEYASGHGGKGRGHPAKLVSGLTQPYRVTLPQGILECCPVSRQASPKRLTDVFEYDGVAPADGQQYSGVKHRTSRKVGPRTDIHDSLNRRPQTGSLYRLGQEVIHPRREAALPIFLA